MVEFYITNVCNLTCRGCNRFNNLGLKGWQRWQDHASEYESWAKRLDIKLITLIGGEPTLHPQLETWCANLRRLWPDSDIMIQSNGTYWRKEFIRFWDDYRIGVSISLHDESTAEDIIFDWHKIAAIEPAYQFHQNALIETDGHFIVHHSNIDQAFASCDMKHDHTMFAGKLYKCPTMVTLPQVISQKDVRLTNRQKEILDSYTPLSFNCSDQDLEKFIQDRDTPISACEFCPAEMTWHAALGKKHDKNN